MVAEFGDTTVVGSRIGDGLMAENIPFLVVGENEASFGPLAERGIENATAIDAHAIRQAVATLPGSPSVGSEVMRK